MSYDANSPGFAGFGTVKCVIETHLLEKASDPETLDQLERLHAMNRLGTPKEVANAVVWLCSDESSS